MDIRFTHIGKGNVVNANETLMILQPGYLSARRYVDEAKKAGTLVDATQGKRIRSIIVMKGGIVIQATLSYETLMNRLNGKIPQVTKEDKEESDTDETIFNPRLSDVSDAGTEDE